MAKIRKDHRSGEKISRRKILSAKTSRPIRRSTNSEKEYFEMQSKRFILLSGLVLLTVLVSIFVIYSQFHPNNPTVDIEIPDPESALPLSSMPMGLYSKVGVVSNGGPCAQIGVDVIKRGGNAVDAAIATMLCDGVLCPEYMGLGGGFIMSIYNSTTKKVTSVNARETAPAAATSSMFIKDPSKSVTGGLAIAVPGELKGYSTIHKLYGGGVSWESLFEPTIRLCEEGVKVSERLQLNLRNHEDLIKNDTMLRKALFDENTGHVKRAGDIYKLPKLAETMRILAKEGADALYNGSLTSKLLEEIRKIDGIITAEDLANYKVEIEDSYTVDLKSGHRIHAGSPPASGILFAYILRILDGMLPAPNPGLDAHRLVEAFKFAYGERTKLGDHRFVDVSQIYDNVKSDRYIESIRSKIFDNFTSSDPKYYGGDFDMPDNHGTANLVITDTMGNTVVATSTLNTYFGCGFMSPSTGITLNNEMDDFSTPGVVNYYGIPSSPANFIQPGKRPMSSMCPTIITNADGDFFLGVGAAGGSKITLASTYVSALKLWYNKSLKESIDKPRIYHQLVPMEVQYEYGVTRDVVNKLREIGHTVKRLKMTIGSAATAIANSTSGMIEAMADFRRPGISAGY